MVTASVIAAAILAFCAAAAFAIAVYCMGVGTTHSRPRMRAWGITFVPVFVLFAAAIFAVGQIDGIWWWVPLVVGIVIAGIAAWTAVREWRKLPQSDGGRRMHDR
jgi:divalent metal cation (Fe/Co/Zn/Cd) transporter